MSALELNLGGAPEGQNYKCLALKG